MDIWAELRTAAESCAPRTIETTLLGDVPYWTDDRGTMNSFIPYSLSGSAARHGMRIIAADWKRNAYTLLLLPTDPTQIIKGE